LRVDTLSPTSRTTVNRGRNRAVADRAKLLALLADGLVAHLGVIAGGHPVVLPTAYAVDPDGPDEAGTLYLHGSVAAGWLEAALAHDVCATVTEVDGLVAARSGFNHSMNYRSAVVIGRPRRVVDAEERRRALDAIIDHMIPDRSATLRPATRKELAATAVLALPLAEASMKERAGGPIDEEFDVAPDVWAGLIPLRRISSGPVTAADSLAAVPEHVAARANRFR
jgi:nitroimidazol reductase NimA-like FMN-containing flavoprotein (pyridoxamine 5'-phosphate oxidase superfamily)